MLKKLLVISSLFMVFLLLPTINSKLLTIFAGPTSTNFELKEYSFGSGGTENSSSTNFSLFGTAGEVDIDKPSSANFKSRNGLIFTLQANIPPAPIFTNPSSYYNKLKIVITTGGNASDTKYAIAISTDNFATDTKYVQNDNTVGTTLGAEDWQIYSSWGGASGVNIIGLSPNITYTVKVAAKKGNYTQTGFGPTAQAATIGPTLTFDIDVSPTDTETSPPYSVNIGTLTPASVTTSASKVWVDLSTNGTSGGNIYVYGTNGGLQSSTTGYTISAVSNDLTSVSQGYGARGNSVSQTSGGPMESLSPYNGAGENVGILDTSKRVMFDSSNQPVTSGRASFELKAKASNIAPAATDYADTLTVIVSASF